MSLRREERGKEALPSVGAILQGQSRSKVSAPRARKSFLDPKHIQR